MEFGSAEENVLYILICWNFRKKSEVSQLIIYDKLFFFSWGIVTKINFS